MKKIFTLLALLISLGLTSEIIASNGNQVVAKSAGCSSIDGKGVATFVVTSPQAQICDLSFLMMPGEYEHSINVPNGNYIVVYYLNGNINTQKIIVK